MRLSGKRIQYHNSWEAWLKSDVIRNLRLQLSLMEQDRVITVINMETKSHDVVDLYASPSHRRWHVLSVGGSEGMRSVTWLMRLKESSALQSGSENVQFHQQVHQPRVHGPLTLDFTPTTFWPLSVSLSVFHLWLNVFLPVAGFNPNL